MGATKLIPKVDGIPKVEELRPITLLNTDYKLLTKWIVLRLRPLMGKIIKSGQLCNSGDKNILFGVQNILSSIDYIKQKKIGAGLVSLDFFKAYDRLYLPFLLEVLSRMNFDTTFRDWIKMLHHGARTRFMLGFLTKEILISFSVRQGDPLAMLLYVIHAEPLLLLLERVVRGLVFTGPQSLSQVQEFKQVSEAFCDDINLFVTQDEDLHAIGRSVLEFEKASGAILSRNNKCVVLGLGKWSNKQSWVLDFLRPVKEIKIFGIWFVNNYSRLLSINWNRRIDKLRKSIFSWTGRHFANIKQRIEVMNCFALSRIFYVASVLPVTRTAVMSINSLVGEFLWKKSGKVLKIAHNEIVNSEQKGGLALLDAKAMCNSLIVTQTFRLMKSGDQKSQRHLKFWMSDYLEDLWEGPTDGVSAHDYESEHFNLLADMVTNVRLLNNVDITVWNRLSNKMVYQSFAEYFPKTKVEREGGDDMSSVWKRLSLLVFNREVQEVAFFMIHNKLPVQERLFRINLSRDPYCSCPAAAVQDICHFFSQCDKTRHFWDWTKDIAFALLGLRNVSDKCLLGFQWPKSRRDKEISFLVGHYVYVIWDMLMKRKLQAVCEREFFGFLRFKYKEALSINAVQEIAGLL